MNRIIVTGRLTRDPELKQTGTGKAVANFTVAVDKGRGQEGADFIDVVCWQKLAELVSNHLGKGRKVLVEGRLQTRSYETNDGQKRKVYEIVAEQVEFLDWPKDGSRSGGRGDFGAEVSFNEDDLPF